MAMVLVSLGCKNNRQPEFTVLGEYTANGFWLHERLNGKVEKLTEKFYWGVADGDNVKKGNIITAKEADTLGFGYINELNFDTAGNLLNCRFCDENNKFIGGWQLLTMNTFLDSAVRVWHDTIQAYDKLKYNKQGELTEGASYDPGPDTLTFKWIKTISIKGDTVKYEVYNSKGDLSGQFLYLFDENGLFTGYEEYGPDGSRKGYDRIIYNDKGAAAEITFFDENNKPFYVMKRTFEYDSHGNWIKMTVRNEKGEMNVHERTITYFK